jgi:hypothetical protein
MKCRHSYKKQNLTLNRTEEVFDQKKLNSKPFDSSYTWTKEIHNEENTSFRHNNQMRIFDVVFRE